MSMKVFTTIYISKAEGAMRVRSGNWQKPSNSALHRYIYQFNVLRFLCLVLAEVNLA